MSKKKKSRPVRNRLEEMDFDYLEKLNPEEKAFMHGFIQEYIHANFKHGGKIIHNTPSLKKDCEDRNNARNRDIHSRNKAAGKMDSLNDIHTDALTNDNMHTIWGKMGKGRSKKPKK